LLNRTGREAYIPQNVTNGDGFITSEKQQVWHDALAISQSVGGLPLALDQASAYINQMNLGFSLGDYLRIYRQEGQPLIGQATYSGSHKPVAATLSLAMKRLLDSPHVSVRLAGEMLKLFAFLAPIDIPLRLADMALTNMIFTNTKQDMTPVDIIDVLQHAHDLRLLNYDAQQQIISLHQIVHDVIWEIIDSQEEKLNWLSHAVRVVASAIEATDVSPVNIYLHVHALSLRIQLLQSKGLDLEAFWQQKRGESNIVRLREIVEDLKVLAAIENGARWEILVFGTEDPTFGDFVHSYVGWHNVEDPHWQKRSEHIIASISRVCSPNLARNVFVCLAMLMHYWWGSYMLEDPSTEPLLDIWQRSHTNLRDQKLVKVLRTLFHRYPPERNYQAQKSSYSRSNWKAVRNACAEIKDILLADIPEEDRNSPSYRYAFAMLNIYEAQARTAALQAGQEPDLEALTLIEEAEEFLWDNEDFYHAVWAIRELSEAYFRLAGQHLQLSSFRQSEKVQLEEKAAELFAHADQTAVRGIETSIAMAKQQNDELDLEVLTNLFRLQADIAWQVKKDVRLSGVYRCICIYSAYIWIQSEMDEFSTEFFAEQIERTIAWWQELKDISTDSLTKAIELMSLFWHKPSLPTTNNLIENGQWENLCQMLLPVGLTRTELTEETAVDSYLQQVAKVEASMVERLPILSGKLQHKLPDSFAKILKVRATSTDK
jgi:hypothetical protein